MSEVTHILNLISAAHAESDKQLAMLVFSDLRHMATRKLRKGSPGNTLQATALVNETYLRLVGNETTDWQNRAHFFAAAEAMPRVLVDAARRRTAKKRAGELTRSDIEIESPTNDEDAIAINDALDQLEEADPATAKLVQLRFHAAMSMN